MAVKEAMEFIGKHQRLGCSKLPKLGGQGSVFSAPNKAGQIIATSHDLTPNGGLVREFPKNPLNSGLGIIVICPVNKGYLDIL